MALASADNETRRPVEDTAFRRKLAEVGVALDALELSELRILTALTAGQSPGAVSSIMKVQTTELMQAIDELALQALGTYASVLQTEARSPDSNAPFVGPEAGLTVTPRYLNDRAGSIYGGSNEIQRNIVARLILGI